MEKVCPRCNLPIEGTDECEYCGFKLSKYKTEINDNLFYTFKGQKQIKTIACPKCRKQMGVEEEICRNCGFSTNMWTKREAIIEKSKKKTLLKRIIVGICFALFIALCAFWIIASMIPEKLTADDIAYIKKRIPELETKIEKIKIKIRYRDSYDVIYGISKQSSDEWKDRHWTLVDYYRSIINGFEMELLLGKKEPPPKRFKYTEAFKNSRDRHYFED